MRDKESNVSTTTELWHFLNHNGAIANLTTEIVDISMDGGHLKGCKEGLSSPCRTMAKLDRVSEVRYAPGVRGTYNSNMYAHSGGSSTSYVLSEGFSSRR